MTIKSAEMIIARHKAEKYYSISCLQSGEVTLKDVYENGFTFTRKTEYMETFGFYEELYNTTDIHDGHAYNIAEVVTKRLK